MASSSVNMDVQAALQEQPEITIRILSKFMALSSYTLHFLWVFIRATRLRPSRSIVAIFLRFSINGPASSVPP